MVFILHHNAINRAKRMPALQHLDNKQDYVYRFSITTSTVNLPVGILGVLRIISSPFRVFLRIFIDYSISYVK